MHSIVSWVSDLDIWQKIVICSILSAAVGIVLAYISRKRCLRLVGDWARLHQFTIVSIRQPLIVPLWQSGRGWKFFRATLRDNAGAVRECWIRCPAFALVFFGKREDFVKIVDDEGSSA
jgi:hypothetical protein